MKIHILRIFALVLCLMIPISAVADTYLVSDDAVHADFTLGFALHADGFPETDQAHLSDWEDFLSRVTLEGSLDGQAFLQQESRMYMEAAVCIDGEEMIPFVYDGYHSYRYVTSPLIGEDSIHFQMHNFFDFMMKPYYFMELPTNYIAMFMYPNATYFLADSFYTPVAELIEEVRAEALADDEEALADEETATAETADETIAEETAVAETAVDESAVEETAVDETVADESAVDEVAAEEAIADEDITSEEETEIEGTLTYTISYEQLYELAEGLNYITTDDDAWRVYCYFDCLLAELYASYMMTDTLSSLDMMLMDLDPDEEGMTVVETATSMVCTLGGVDIFTKTEVDGVVEIYLQLPIPTDYVMTLEYRRENTGDANDVTAVATIAYEDEVAVALEFTGEGLPAEGALSGEGSITATMYGYVFEEEPSPLTLEFSWSRTAAEMPYTLDLEIDWIHPETGLAAFSVYFSADLEETDASVFNEVSYEQNDFFSLNDMFLQEYKESWTPTTLLYLLPVVMEMPSGVLDDIVNFGLDTDILISLIE